MQDIVSSPIFLTNSFSYLSNSHGFYHVSIPAGIWHSDEMYNLRLTFSKSVPRFPDENPHFQPPSRLFLQISSSAYSHSCYLLYQK